MAVTMEWPDLADKSETLYRISMSRMKHPKREIEEALVYAEAVGWTVTTTKYGHRWGVIRCAESSRSGCQYSVWSTPRNPQNHARHLLRMVRKCPHKSIP